ncbi:peptide ABC transporter permease [Lactococcus hodotermopsidis]|uniref:Peptide ABC transporter permease n=1 Tax=Pseudolactococcus hodotermopsidis TaxID=2709157 RepID=A0A6A0BEM0_9LACT|nr:hypothetical protein [Lactococcus hodotermopsidis]GFH43216.1 peptide ABC transporter permease [Lactococcus hodotermopsidis]
MFFKQSIISRTIWLIMALVLAMFGLAYVMLYALDKVSQPSYDNFMLSVYAVFTQFGFLVYSFVVAYTFHKDNQDKTVLFYRFSGLTAMTYFLRKLAVLASEFFLAIVLFNLATSIVYGNFSHFLQMLALCTAVTLYEILVVSFFAMLLPNLLLSIAATIFFWIFTLILSQLGGIFKYAAYFDQSNDLFSKVQSSFKGGNVWLSSQDNLHLLFYVAVILVLVTAFSKMNQKRWLKSGI